MDGTNAEQPQPLVLPVQQPIRPRGSHRYWICTVPEPDFEPGNFSELPHGLSYIAGQKETGASGYRHWQFISYFKNKASLSKVKSVFGRSAHCEPTRSDAARQYCHKEETRIDGTVFAYGKLSIRRNSGTDWQKVFDSAKLNDFDSIEPQIKVCHYGNLRRIASDFGQAVGIERKVYVFWGKTGAGKSRRAWSEAGLEAYPKGPTSKFWDGYRDQENVVLDEFRGGVDISHVLRWFDRYPILVEIKGSSIPLKAKTIWVTSNLHPRDWYPTIDDMTLQALLRRLEIFEFAL